jgi:hypothetical protein
MWKNFEHLKFTFNIIIVFTGIFLINYIEYKLEEIKLMEVQHDHSIIVEMKLKD